MSEKPDALVALLEQASREGLLEGDSLQAFAAALRERAEIVIDERLRRGEEELAWRRSQMESLEQEVAWRRSQMESLEQEVAWRRQSFDNLLADVERLASPPAWRLLRLRTNARRLVSAWRKDRR